MRATLKELLEKIDRPLGLDEIAQHLDVTKAVALKELLVAHNEGWITYFAKEERTNLYFVFKGIE